jgi:hypothetical protein
MSMGEKHSGNNTHCRHRTRDAVWRSPDHGMCPALQRSQVSTDFRRHVACDQFDQDRTDEKVRRILENRCHTHDVMVSLVLPAPSLCQRMDLDHVAALGGTLIRNTVFIGRKAAIAHVEIVFKMRMSADE